MDFQHKPVLLDEVITLLNPQPGQIIVDGTTGGGGHSKAVLQRILPGGQLIGLDQDQDALQAARETLAPLGEENFTLVHSNFIHILNVLSELEISRVDGMLFDLGVSSYQLDTAERGFSYQYDAPLDMRMDQNASTSAFDLVNRLPVEELTRIIWDYGEERWAKRIALFIEEARKRGPVKTTGELVEIIKKAIPSSARREGPHPAKRTFQAFRIAVNRELEILPQAFRDGVRALKPGGRLAVITFHSLEDRITKDVFKEMAKGCICPPDFPVCVCGRFPLLKLVNTKPLISSERELEENPRSRSAKLRVVEKLG